MFSITDNERLRDAYALLMFMQSDIPASAEKRAAVKNLAATVKMEIRAYNNRPAPDVHIICADYDGRLELVQLPDKLDEAHEMDATNWFLNHRYLRSYNSPYDCTDEVLTNKKSPYTGPKVNAGGFLRATEVAKYKIKSGPCRAALYKSRSFSSAYILHGTNAAVKTFCPVLRS